MFELLEVVIYFFTFLLLSCSWIYCKAMPRVVGLIAFIVVPKVSYKVARNAIRRCFRKNCFPVNVYNEVIVVDCFRLSESRS